MRRALALWLVPLAVAAAADGITIDASAPTHPFPHFWEQMFGSGRANLSLRESYRQDLRAVKKATDFRFVRFHGIFDDENGVYSEDAQGRPVYNWSYVDQIYDGLLENHVRPFVELSFMPSKLAVSQTPHAFWYKPLPQPPKDQDKWAALVAAFASHLVERYGIDEVAQWYFEVWNEPNIDFWTGNPKQDTYFRFYAATAKALRGVSPRLRVGGPATAQAAWVGEFLDYCVKNDVPVDFASTHVYGNDSAEDVLGTHDRIPQSEMVAVAVKKVREEIKRSPRPNTPLIWSEFNATYKNEVDVTDSPFMGPWLANTIRLCDGLVDSMSYWSFSDVFEEQGVVTTPFYGGYGLVAAGNIPKAAYNDFKLLHLLGDVRFDLNSDSAIATRRKDGTLVLAIWNYGAPEEAGAEKVLDLTLKGFTGMAKARIRVVDASHGSPLAAWEAMGKPSFPSRQQQQTLRKAAELAPPADQKLDARNVLTITLPAKALAVVEVSKGR